MANITDRTTYLRGLAEGMKLDREVNEQRLILEMLDVMDEMAHQLTDVNDSVDELNEYVEDIDNDLSDEAKEAIIAKINAVVTDNGGTVDGVDKWGTRKLAYAINYKTEGYYVLVNFSAAATLPDEVERVLRITDGVVRFMVVKK